MLLIHLIGQEKKRYIILLLTFLQTYKFTSILMKILQLLFLGIILLCSFGCDNKHQASKLDYLSQYRDTLIGRFNGKDIDTLICEPMNRKDEIGLCDWKIYSINKTVDTLFISKRYSIKMVQEGDLDGNGTDEFGIRREVEQGTWDSYYIYSYNNGEWKYLINPIWTYSTHFYEELYNGNDVAERTDNPNIIKVRFSDVRNNGEDFLIIDTLMQINPQPLE